MQIVHHTNLGIGSTFLNHCNNLCTTVIWIPSEAFQLIEIEWRIYASVNYHYFRKWLVAWSAPSHFLNQWWNTFYWTLRNKRQWNLKKIAFKKIHLKMSSGKWWSSCLGLVFMYCSVRFFLRLFLSEFSSMTSTTATANDRSIECLFNRLFRLTTKKHQRSALLFLCEGDPPMPGAFSAQRDSNA